MDFHQQLLQIGSTVGAAKSLSASVSSAFRSLVLSRAITDAAISAIEQHLHDTHHFLINAHTPQQFQGTQRIRWPKWEQDPENTEHLIERASQERDQRVPFLDFQRL